MTGSFCYDIQMSNEQVIQKTKDYVEQKFNSEGTGHDWLHMYRVWKLAKHIAVTEQGADMFIVELGALMHDIADWKFHDGDMEAVQSCSCLA